MINVASIHALRHGGAGKATYGSAGTLGITTQPSAAADSGDAFAQQPVIQLKNGSGDPVSISGVTVTATLGTTQGGTLGATLTAVTNGSGVATFTDLAITDEGAGGNYTLVFTASGFTQIESNDIDITGGAGATLLFEENFDDNDLASRGWYDMAATPAIDETEPYAGAGCLYQYLDIGEFSPPHGGMRHES